MPYRHEHGHVQQPVSSCQLTLSYPYPVCCIPHKCYCHRLLFHHQISKTTHALEAVLAVNVLMENYIVAANGS